MAHQSQAEFCLGVKQRFPERFRSKWVLDVGSLDINGSNRPLFESCVYVGLDIGPGRNVDVVSPVHSWAAPDACFDTIISTECFEHDMHYEASLRAIVRLLAPGGLFLFTCAGYGRPEHGTPRTDEWSSPLTCSFPDWANHYKNLNPFDIVSAFEDFPSVFSTYTFDSSVPGDLYFWGVKK